jgi:hypothetical protein
MIRSLFGPTTLPAQLRGGLEESMTTHKRLAEEVAFALTSSDAAATATGDGAEAQAARDDLVQKMSTLADTQIRYEAEAKLLQAAYERLRTAMRSNG